MAKNRKVLTLYGFDELIKQIEEAEGAVDKAAESAVAASSQIVRAELKDFMANTPRNKTGRTVKSLRPVQVENYRGKIESKVGFDISKGGIASVFWEHGSPRREPQTKFISKAFGNKKRIEQAQKEVLEKVLSRIKGGKK